MASFSNNHSALQSHYNISPWEQEHKIPEYYLNSYLPPPVNVKHIFTPKRKIKFFTSSGEKTVKLKSQPNFAKQRNLGCLECVQYNWQDPKGRLNSKEKFRDKKIIIARKRTRNGLEIKSIKKKLLNTTHLEGRHFPFFSQINTPKQRLRFITQSKLNNDSKISQSQTLGFPKGKQRKAKKANSNSNSISRQFLAEISTIATIASGKLGAPNQQVVGNWKAERQLFLATNNKFKSWQKRTRKAIASSITLPVSFS